jgi:diguanylate cyclase (GGDEF)-like protein
MLGLILTGAYFAYRAIRYGRQELLKANQQLVLSNKLLAALASTDELTNIDNRRSIMKKLDNTLARSLRENLALSIIMIDVDCFKRVNDTYGHIAGDAVLQKISERILLQLRDYDHIGRYGGEEFIIILPNSQIDEASTIAERIRRSIQASPIITPSGKITMTISLGLAQMTSKDTSVTAFINRAEKALIESKYQGRNRVTVATVHP